MKKFCVHVRGKKKEWGFEFYGDAKHWEGWTEDGLEVTEVVNSIPMWAVDFGLTRVWFFIQNVFNFRNPFK